jgi:hypothetical protein
MKNKTSGKLKISKQHSKMKLKKQFEDKFNLELDITDKSLFDFKKSVNRKY